MNTLQTIPGYNQNQFPSTLVTTNTKELDAIQLTLPKPQPKKAVR